MKVLVTFFSQCGNTEKIARAILEEASVGNEADCKKLADITPEEVAGYDVVFIGLPLHSGSLATPVKISYPTRPIHSLKYTRICKNKEKCLAYIDSEHLNDRTGNDSICISNRAD